jgi:hypothetical protein
MGLARSGRHGGVVDRPLLDLSGATWHADHHAWAWYRDHALLMCLANEIFQHRFCNFEFGDHTIPQRADGDDIGRRATDHRLGLSSNGDGTPAFLLHGHPGWLINHNALAAHVDQCVCRAKVNANIEGEEAKEPIEGIKRQFGHPLLEAI